MLSFKTEKSRLITSFLTVSIYKLDILDIKPPMRGKFRPFRSVLPRGSITSL